MNLAGPTSLEVLTTMLQKLALQLYSVRRETRQDFPAVLRELKDQGWAGVEFAGLQGYDADSIASVLKTTGLKAAGMHIGLDRLRGDLDSVLQEATALDCQDLVCPSIPRSEQSEAGFRAVRAELNDLARRLAPRGFRLSYHNHAFEFETRVDGDFALRYLLEPVPQNQLLAQIDTYWVKRGGADPLAFMAPYAGRLPLLHLKDLDAQGHDVAVGAGVIDVPGILTWGERSGVEWYIVESEVEVGAMQVARDSLTNLHRIITTLKGR